MATCFEETSGSDNRPTVLPFISSTPGGPQDFAVGKRPWVAVTLKNTGQAHAYNVQPDVALGIFPYPLPADFSIDTIPATVSEFTLGIGDSSVITLKFAEPITEEEMAAILDGTEVRLYLAARIRYRIPSGQQCQKRVLQSVGGPDFAAALKLAKETGHSKLNWDYAGKYNDTNKECQ